MASVHHIALRTGDVGAVAAFYERVVGLERVRDTERAVWLGAAGVVIMLERREATEPSVPARSMELLAFRWDGSFDEIAPHLAANSVEAEGSTAHSVYFRDPDGRRLAFSTHPLVG